MRAAKQAEQRVAQALLRDLVSTGFSTSVRMRNTNVRRSSSATMFSRKRCDESSLRIDGTTLSGITDVIDRHDCAE